MKLRSNFEIGPNLNSTFILVKYDDLITDGQM